MKNIFIVPNPKKDMDFSITSKTVKLLHLNGFEIFIQEKYSYCKIENCTYTQDIPDNTDLVIVIGGDGSFIDASGHAIAKNIPILGINMGKVGYLSEVEPSEIAILSKISSGEYKTDEKMLLCVKNIEGNREFVCDRLAVNDIVISHESHIGIADFVVYSNEGGVRYRADGVVFSTPAGSTAYSLSAGGPIVSHEAEAVIVTPIAPHSFFNRSIVFGKNEQIKVKNTGVSPLNISVDGRTFSQIAPGDKCEIFVSHRNLKVLTFKDNNMFSNLFGKIQILEDII